MLHQDWIGMGNCFCHSCEEKMTDQPFLSLQKDSLQEGAEGEVRGLGVSSLNVSPKKTSAIHFVCAFKLHYVFGIFEGDVSLRCRTKMKPCIVKQVLTYLVCPMTSWNKTQESIMQAQEVWLIPAFDSHLPHHKGPVSWIYVWFIFYPN